MEETLFRGNLEVHNLSSKLTCRHDNSLKDEEMTALAAFGACCTARYSSRQAFAKHKRAMQASDMVHEVGNSYQVLFER
jgi:NAD(P)H-hydrate repair Nnr-like enzyme with NAD(P)H-hydrate dehydratase domain